MSAWLPRSLLGISAGLVIVLLYQAVAPVSPLAVPPGDVVVREPAPLTAPAAYAPPSPDEFAVINTRPVFDPTRQPTTEPDQVGTAKLTPPNVTLVGVAIGSRNSVALLKKADARSATSIQIGQSIDGWKVVRIESSAVVLRAGVTDYTVKMRAAAGLPQPVLNNVPPAGVTEPPGR